jgi:glycosyltransferase involved in cell wall biosynthesis
MPKVSIIIPCFNQAQYLYECVASIIMATSEAVEVIIVDDGSTENTLIRSYEEVVSCFADDRITLNLVQQENRGLPGARNAGLAIAKGEFVQLLDADDLLLPGKIDLQIRHLVVSGLSVSISEFVTSNEQLDHFNEHRGIVGPHAYSFEEFALKWERGLSIPIHCALFRRDVFSQVLFDEEVRAKEDWIFWSKISNRRIKIGYFDVLGAIYRVHAKSMCRSMADIGNQWLTAAKEISKIQPTLQTIIEAESLDWYKKCYSQTMDGDKSSELLAKTSLQAGEHSHIGEPSYKDFIFEHKANRAGSVPRFTFVVPVYGHERYLAECINSVLGLKDVAFELILIDDCNKNTRITALLEEAASRPGVFLIKNDINIGISASQNLAISQASGEFVCFLDCDDYIITDSLERVLKASNWEKDYYYSNRLHLHANGETKVVTPGNCYDDSDKRFRGNLDLDLLNGMYCSHLKIIRRELILECGGFSVEYDGIQDWVLALEFSSKKIEHINEILYVHRIHSNSVTSSNRQRQLRNTNKVRRKYGDRFRNPRRSTLELDIQRLYTPTMLQDAWLIYETRLCVPRGWDLDGLWFYREFNSYVDKFLFEDEVSYSALLGTSWCIDSLQVTLPPKNVSQF